MFAGALIGMSALLPQSAFAEDSAPAAQSLAQLAQLAVKKGYKNIGLGEVCDRLHVGGACKGYQLSAAVDANESQKFGLTAGWLTSLNVLPERSGTADIVITAHDDHIGYAYLIGADDNLRAVAIGMSGSADGKNWHWKPGAITGELAEKFALEKTYWLAQAKDIQNLPDRKD